MADVIVPYEGTEPYIFISYSHLDFDAITPILRTMQDEGYRFWYDEGIHGSDTWDDVIAAHVINCEFFIAFITGNYIKSEVCNDELSWARNQKKEITLIYMEDVELSEGLEMRMNRLQKIYLSECKFSELFYNRLLNFEKMDLCCEKKTGGKKISQAEVQGDNPTKPYSMDAAEQTSQSYPPAWDKAEALAAAHPDKKSKLPIITGVVVIALIALAIIIFTMTSSGGGKSTDLNDSLKDKAAEITDQKITEVEASVEETEAEGEAAIVERVEVNAPPVSNAAIKSITATSSLAEFDMVHTPNLMIDGDYSTAWCEGVDGYGTGESITINLDGVYKITGVEVYSGYQKNQNLFEKNSKPRDILLSFSDGSKITCELGEFYGGQRVHLPRPVQADSMTITIQSVYPGSTYDDTVITEIKLFDDDDMGTVTTD